MSLKRRLLHEDWNGDRKSDPQSKRSSTQGSSLAFDQPLQQETFSTRPPTLESITDEPSLVIYDNLGGGVGDTVGLWKAEKPPPPFDPPIPIDAINAALVDETFYTPKEDA